MINEKEIETIIELDKQRKNSLEKIKNISKRPVKKKIKISFRNPTEYVLIGDHQDGFLNPTSKNKNNTPDIPNEVFNYISDYSNDSSLDIHKDKIIQLLKNNFKIAFLIYKGFYGLDGKLTEKFVLLINELIETKKELFEKSNIDEKEIILKNEIKIVKENNNEYWRFFAYERYIITKYHLSSIEKYYHWIADITENQLDWTSIKRTYLNHKKKGKLTKHKF